VYDADGNYVLPNNAKVVNGDRLQYSQPSYPDQYRPTVASPSGENFFDLNDKSLWITVTGRGFVAVKMNPQIVVAYDMPTMTEEEFYGSNIIVNLAYFLGVDPGDIKVVDIVSEGGRRRRRSTKGIRVTLEIGNHPMVTSGGAGQQTHESLSKASAKLKQGLATGELEQAIGYKVQGAYVYDPPPPPSSSDYPAYVNETYDGTVYYGPLREVKDFLFHDQPVPSHEGSLFTQPANLKLLDTAVSCIDCRKVL
jgi:hypothetical protein